MGSFTNALAPFREIKEIKQQVYGNYVSFPGYYKYYPSWRLSIWGEIFSYTFFRLTDIETNSVEYVLCDNRPQYFQAFKELAENQFLL